MPICAKKQIVRHLDYPLTGSNLGPGDSPQGSLRSGRSYFEYCTKEGIKQRPWLVDNVHLQRQTGLRHYISLVVFLKSIF